jgi:hypothetical protein
MIRAGNNCTCTVIFAVPGCQPAVLSLSAASLSSATSPPRRHAGVVSSFYAPSAPHTLWSVATLVDLPSRLLLLFCTCFPLSSAPFRERARRERTETRRQSRRSNYQSGREVSWQQSSGAIGGMQAHRCPSPFSCNASLFHAHISTHSNAH